MSREGKHPPALTALHPHSHNPLFPPLVSSPACQLIRILADTLIRVARCYPDVCLPLIPPRGVACTIASLKPLSVPCVEERDKKKKNVHEDCSQRRRSRHQSNLNALPSREEKVRH